MAASTAVFAIPELVENILECLSAIPLFRFRRVNSTFNDIIERQGCRAAMLLEPSGRLSLFRLMRVLQSPNMQRALRPFKIYTVHTVSGGEKLRINIGTVGVYSQGDIDDTVTKLEKKVYSCNQQNGSWRDIRLDRGMMELRVDFGVPGHQYVLSPEVKPYPPEKVTTVGELVEEAVTWLRSHSSEEKRKAQEAEMATKAQLMEDVMANEQHVGWW